MKNFPEDCRDAATTKALPASSGWREVALHLHFPFHDVQVSYQKFVFVIFHYSFLSFSRSIVSLVAVIYCIVIIYLPSLIEAETNFVVSLMPVIVISIFILTFVFIFISPLYLYLPPMIEVETIFVVIFVSFFSSKSVNLPSPQNSFFPFQFKFPSGAKALHNNKN